MKNCHNAKKYEKFQKYGKYRSGKGGWGETPDYPIPDPDLQSSVQWPP